MNLVLRTSFSISAKMMEQGNVARLYRPIRRVFIIRNLKFGYSINLLKYSSPTHSLPQMPFLGEKSRKAIWTPYIGI